MPLTKEEDVLGPEVESTADEDKTGSDSINCDSIAGI